MKVFSILIFILELVAISADLVSAPHYGILLSAAFICSVLAICFIIYIYVSRKKIGIFGIIGIAAMGFVVSDSLLRSVFGVRFFDLFHLNY